MTEKIDYDIVEDKYIVLKQNAGFFSCCSVRLNSIITFYNRYGRLPEKVDSSYQFRLYKLHSKLEQDITYDYFAREDDAANSVPPPRKIDYLERYQFSNFEFLDYKGIVPIVQRYFSPSQQIQNAICDIEDKYKLDYKNLCVLFFRGNDKGTEMFLPSYSAFLERARAQLKTNPQTTFLLQSDETEFLEYMARELGHCGDGDIPPRVIIFNDEIRHMRRQRSSVDKLPDSTKTNYYYSQLFLAITIIMSRANTVICTSGNCSIWIAFYRGGADGIIQFGGK